MRWLLLLLVAWDLPGRRRRRRARLHGL